MPSVSAQGQTDTEYFDISNACGIVPHNNLLRKLCDFGFSYSFVDWFHSYLVTRQSFVSISGTLSFSLLSCQVWSASKFHLRPITFEYKLSITDTRDSIRNSKYLLFAEDLKICHSIRNVDKCKLLQHDIHSVKNCCSVNGVEFNFDKTMTISFTNKRNSIYLITNYVTIWYHAPSVLKISVFYWTASFIFTSILTTYFYNV
jgi:hypothetical protein